jgi:hypothetical protein
MELVLNRHTRTELSTIGDLFADGVKICFILEDKDRGLTSDMRPDEIRKIKVYGKTAIPTGRYEVVLTYSNRFKQLMPLLLNVPGFEGVRIHSGNTAAHTEGCPLTGLKMGKDMVMESRKAYSQVFILIKQAMRKEKVFITIQ